MRILAIAFVICSAAASAEDFQIKEFSVGMRMEDFKYQKGCNQNQEGAVTCYESSPSSTVGGEYLTAALVHFGKDKKANQIYLAFKSSSFDQIKAAILSKYQKMRCKKETVKTRVGVEYVNEYCSMSSKKETLAVVKYATSIDAGSILITADSVLDEMAEKAKSKQSDI